MTWENLPTWYWDIFFWAFMLFGFGIQLWFKWKRERSQNTP